ncbi:hypothetical protein [Caulobacter sp. S45]|jgi:hypothetical protein|uniref:hypothetical protein n=1 Tax=Caulobacter sp. S45 TaxID=1641861 RepID=UPI00131E3EB2|nr:hypothetical protein [Caulobacter sp. S45]
MFGTEISTAQAAFLQTTTAVVQAVVSVSLLAWYVLAAHLDRDRIRRERSEDFDSLVRLCRDLGIDAKDKTNAHRCAASMIVSAPSDLDAAVRARLAAWKTDMTVIYVCLNEVPHYEVRNPAFSTALTRLWMEVDARTVDPKRFDRPEQLELFLDQKLARICREVDAMADLLKGRPLGARDAPRRLVGAAKRRGKIYATDGSPEEAIEDL